jgi:hypothetical protein
MKKGSSKRISVVKRVVPQLWGTSNGTFVTDRVGNIEISFVEFSASKKVCLQPDIVGYSPGDQAPMYDLIIGKQTMHNLGVCVCVFLASGYIWVTVMHEIPISSTHTMTSLINRLPREDNNNRQDPPTHEGHS